MDTIQKEKTKFHTSVIAKDDFLNTLKLCAKDFIDYFYNGTNYDDDLIPVNISDDYQFINFIAEKKSWPETARKLYLQCFVNSENNKKCSGIIAVYLLSKLLIGENKFQAKDFKNDSLYAVKCKKAEALKSLSFFIDINIFEFIKNVISETGVFGSISIESTKASVPTLEFFSGHTFNLGLHNHFCREQISAGSARLLLFDGAITEVSQVDHIFTQANEKKESVVIVARSFGNDVISTINVNSKRNTLQVFPIVISDEITNINSFFDISVCSGASVITAETGRRISNINLEDLVSVSDFAATGRRINFSSKMQHKASIQSRIDGINRKIDHAIWNDEMSAEDIRTVYSSRIDSLSGNLIKLWVPGSDEFLVYVRKNFIFALNYISSFSNFGKIKTSDFFKGFNLPRYLPPDILEASIVSSKNMYKDIKSAGCYIVIDD